MRIAGVWRSAVQVAAAAAVVMLVACNSDRATSAASPSLGAASNGYYDNGFGNPHYTDDSGCTIDTEANTAICTIGVAGLGNRGLNAYGSEGAAGLIGFRAIVDATWTCTKEDPHEVVVNHKHPLSNPSPQISDVLYHNGAIYFTESFDLNAEAGNIGHCGNPFTPSDVVIESGWKAVACVFNHDENYVLTLDAITGGELADSNQLNGAINLPSPC